MSIRESRPLRTALRRRGGRSSLGVAADSQVVREEENEASALASTLTESDLDHASEARALSSALAAGRARRAGLPTHDDDVPDPIGQGHTEYQECLLTIKEAVDKIVGLI